MLEQVFEMIKKMEEGIGNQCRVSISAKENALLFRIFWPDGFVMAQKIDKGELNFLVTDESFTSHIIQQAKSGHPKLMPTMS